MLSKRIDTAAMETVLPRTTVSSGRLIRAPQGEPHGRNSDEFQFRAENARANASPLSRTRLYVSQIRGEEGQNQSLRRVVKKRSGNSAIPISPRVRACVRACVRVSVRLCVRARTRASRVLLPGIV